MICKAVEYHWHTRTSRGILPSYISLRALECSATVLNQYAAMRKRVSQSFVVGQRRVTSKGNSHSLPLMSRAMPPPPPTGEEARRVLVSLTCDGDRSRKMLLSLAVQIE